MPCLSAACTNVNVAIAGKKRTKTKIIATVWSKGGGGGMSSRPLFTVCGHAVAWMCCPVCYYTMPRFASITKIRNQKLLNHSG